MRTRENVNIVVPLQVQICYLNFLPASAKGAALCCYSGCSVLTVVDQWFKSLSEKTPIVVNEHKWTPFTNGSSAAGASRTRAAPSPVPD